MYLDISTPAVLFTTICLLLSAYIGRFTKLSRMIRTFQKDIEFIDNQEGLSEEDIRHYGKRKYYDQIDIFKKRVSIIKHIHISGVLSLFCATTSMFLTLLERPIISYYTFAFALIFFMSALFLVLVDIYYSLKGLDSSIDLQ